MIGVPYMRIGAYTFALAVLFVVASVVFSITNQHDLATSALGAAIGIAVGAGAATAAVAQHEKNNNGPDSQQHT